MHKPQSLFNLIIALHVSVVTVTHLQEHKTTATTASGNRYTVLLSAAIVEKLEFSNYIHKSQSLFNLITALHVSCVTITHLQEHKTTASTASGSRYTVLLSAAVVEKLELFHNSSRQQYGVTATRCCRCSCFVLLKMGDSDARNM